MKVIYQTTILVVFFSAMSAYAAPSWEESSKASEQICHDFVKLYIDDENQLDEIYYPGVALDRCEDDYQDNDEIKKCILRKGNEIDLAITYLDS